MKVVADLATAKARLTTNTHLALGCVVEPFRRDLTDVQVAVRTYPTVQLSAIEKPIRRSDQAEILDYRDKYVGGEGMVSAPRELPATLPPGQRAQSGRNPPAPAPGAKGRTLSERKAPAASMPTMRNGGSWPEEMSAAAVSAARQETPWCDNQSSNRFWASEIYSTG